MVLQCSLLLKSSKTLVKTQDFNTLIDSKLILNNQQKTNKKRLKNLWKFKKQLNLLDYLNRKRIRLFVSSKFLYIYWHRFIKTNK